MLVLLAFWMENVHSALECSAQGSLRTSTGVTPFLCYGQKGLLAALMAICECHDQIICKLIVPRPSGWPRRA